MLDTNSKPFFGHVSPYSQARRGPWKEDYRVRTYVRTYVRTNDVRTYVHTYVRTYKDSMMTVNTTTTIEGHEGDELDL